jgi:hypothetical protein
MFSILMRKSYVQARAIMTSSTPNMQSYRVAMAAHETLEDEEDEDSLMAAKGEKVELGFNFAVISQEIEKNDPFYIVICNRPQFRNPYAFTDDRGNQWCEGDVLIKGSYYE